MRNLTRLSFIAAIVLSSAAAFATTGPKANYVTLFNDSQSLISQVKVGDANIKLHQHDQTIPTGGQERVALNKSFGCDVSLTVVFDDGTSSTQPNFNACTTGKLDVK